MFGQVGFGGGANVNVPARAVVMVIVIAHGASREDYRGRWWHDCSR